MESALYREDVNKFSESKHAGEIWRRASSLYENENVVVLYFNEGSDDFEPMMYSSNNNRGSTSLKMMTIAPPLNMLLSLCNSYPVAIRKKAGNHELIKCCFAKEMVELQSGHINDFM